MKRSIFTVFFVLILCLVAFGFYRGWFTLSTRNPDTENNKVNVNLSVDPDKMKEDAETVKKKTGELTDSITGKSDQFRDPKLSK